MNWSNCYNFLRVDGCPGNCSGQGTCNSGVCTCDKGWKGDRCDTCDSCDTERCGCHNGGVCKEGVCECQGGFSGTNCEVNVANNRWQHLSSTGTFHNRDLFCSVVHSLFNKS